MLSLGIGGARVDPLQRRPPGMPQRKRRKSISPESCGFFLCNKLNIATKELAPRFGRTRETNLSEALAVLFSENYSIILPWHLSLRQTPALPSEVDVVAVASVFGCELSALSALSANRWRV
jgi:hypothetical protein